MISKGSWVVAGMVLLGGCTSASDGSGPASTASASAPATTAAPSPTDPQPTSGTSASGSPTESGAASTPSDADPTPDPAQDLPLIAAAGRGDPDRVTRLLRRGASVRATDARGRTPLVAAAYGNHVDAAAILVAAGADPNEKDQTVQSAYLISTSEVGDDPALLDLLLDHGADVNSRDSFNGTGLIRAADRGFPRIVERLLRTDIAVDHVNRLGWTALHEAVILGDGSSDYVEVVELLVDAGADVMLPSASDGITPLAHARRLGHDEIARVLEEGGATG